MHGLNTINVILIEAMNTDLIYLGLANLIGLVLLIIVSFKFPIEQYIVKNKKQAETYYEYRKILFLRWNWFLIMIVFGGFSIAITYLAKSELLAYLLFLIAIFLVSLIFTIILTYRAQLVMNAALRNLLKFQKEVLL